jgi:mannopine transport system substrate-binding protein
MFDLGLESAWRVPALALLADGVSPDQLFPLDLDRAYKVMDRVRPAVRAFFTGFTQGQDLLRSGEVTMEMLTDGRTVALIQDGNPVANVYPTPKTFLTTAHLCVPKGAPHKKTAFQFLEYLLSHPKQQAVYASLVNYGPPTKAGAEAAKAAGMRDFNSLHLDQFILDSNPAIVAYIQANSTPLLNRWNAWVTS